MWSFVLQNTDIPSRQSNLLHSLLVSLYRIPSKYICHDSVAFDHIVLGMEGTHGGQGSCARQKENPCVSVGIPLG